MVRLRRGFAAALATFSLGAGAPPPDKPGGWPAALVQLADINGLSASPDGRYVLFRIDRGDPGRNSYDLRWHLVEVATGRVHEVGNGGLPVYDDPGVVRRDLPVWSRDGNAAFVRALNADGAIGIWRIRPDSRTITPLLVPDGNAEGLALSPDGRALAYATGPARAEVLRAEQTEYDSGVRIDETVDLSQALVRGGAVEGRIATQRLIGHWSIRGGLMWQAPRQHHRFEFATGRVSADGPPRAVPPFTPPSLSVVAEAVEARKTTQATWSGGRGGVSARLGTRSLTCRAVLCRDRRVGWLGWRPGTGQVVIGFQDRRLAQTLALWSPSAGTLRVLARSDGLLSGDRHGRAPCALTRTAAFCVHSSAASPPQLVRVDLATGARTVQFDPNSGWRKYYRPQVEPLTLDLAGTTATGVLLMPPGAAPRRVPLFVNYYRCEGFLRGGEGDEWPLPELLEAGFVIACLNKAPEKGVQDAVRSYETGLAAVRALVDRLAEAGTIDRAQVGMGGFSFGSEVALWTAIHSDLLAAVSIASAQWEPANYWLSALQGPKTRELSKVVWGLGPPDETPEAWARLSPANNAARVRAPVLLQLPEQEARQIPELVVRLRDARVPVEFIGFPDENHIKVQPRHRLAVYQRNSDWLRYWLQGERDPSPDKAAQYQRWDAMRRTAKSARSSPALQP